jgi:hypothetical protein
MNMRTPDATPGSGDLQSPNLRTKGDYKSPLLVLLLALAPTLHAGPRSSANYNVPADITDAGGKRTTSASYTNDASVGGVTGIASVAAPAETAKAGYLGQLDEVTGLTLTATSPTVNEGATDQLAAWQSLDDATFLAVTASSVAWSVQSGPLTGISAGGLATAGAVYQNTGATAQGVFAGNTGTFALTVVNTLPDNFGAYAGDQLGDDWQVQYFGLPPNANAGPNLDVSGTGQTNLFKYIAGLNPLDPQSRFTLRIAPVPGQAGQMHLIFNPVVAGRTYTITSKPALGIGTFAPLTNPSAPSDNGTERTITDQSASGAEKFYRVEITQP